MRLRHTLVLTALLMLATPATAYADGPGTDGGFFDNSVVILCLTKDACPIGGAP